MVFDVVHHFAPCFYASEHTSGSSNFYNFSLSPSRVLSPILRKNIPQSDCNRRNRKSTYELYKTLFTPFRYPKFVLSVYLTDNPFRRI